ncbi:uncharacterized protein [Rutidosis leptorrhynchoides]|uniref:uncharacterized protein n=1 Tax=Rutidosis leptorrhynchoides TaxID=125765 RepID=UPI003A998AF8
MEVQLKSPPLELTKKHWKRLLEYWSRENVMASLGREPTRVDMFKNCFSNGSGEGEAARANEQMKELTEKLGDGATDAPGPDDVYVKIMGQHKYGSAEMYGLGVRAKDLWGVPGQSAIRKENAQLKSEKVELADENVGAKVFIKGIVNNEKVEKGWLRRLDLRAVILGIEIGPDWCEVEVQVTINKDESLFRPHDHLVCIHDVIDTSIAWPTALIEVVRNA